MTLLPRRSLLIGASLLCLTTGPLVRAQEAPPATVTVDPLREGFRDPPMTARPRVWWHWVNGNVTQDGIAKDLAWMKRTGIGGLQAFDVDLYVPKVVDQRLAYMTPGWKDAFRFAATRADALGLELTIASSAGWSETGGPWVAPADGMKKLVWSETVVTGGRPLAAPLPAPLSVTGPYQDLHAHGDMMGKPRVLPTLYADVKVLAWPVVAAALLPVPAIATGDGTTLDAAALSDASLDTGASVPRGTAAAPTIVTIDYDRPRTVRSLSMFIPGVADTFSPASVAPRLEASDDGRTWHRVADIKLSPAPTTVSIAPVTASRFRLVLNLPPQTEAFGNAPAEGYAGPPAGITANRGPLKLLDLRLSPEARVNQFEAKAGYGLVADYYALDGDTGGEAKGVDPAAVVDLTTRLRPDGTLDWTPPRGTWRIARLGWSLTGTTNAPAAPEATGLEVDKLDAAAVRRYLSTYLEKYRGAVGADLVGARGIRALLTDSIEVGAFNWTPRMIERFRTLRGYDPTPWLPTLTGAIIGSRTRSDAFLYDFRRTVGDLLASDHYGTVATVAHENGLSVYGEALESGRPSLGDDLDMRAHADIPMAALWTYGRQEEAKSTYRADMRGAASVAHLYGRQYVAAESLTSKRQPWAHAPADLRPVIDMAFVSGVNRPVIHTSVHQPLDKAPGVSLMFFGQYFTRHETWAEMARPWIDYIARTGFLLQQGRNVADVAYFYGEEAPTVAQTEQTYFKDVPVRYGYDFVNATALRDVLKVDGGDLVSPAGARYRLLYLTGTSARMTLPTLRRIAALAEGGATVVGDAPTGSPALGEDGTEYAALVRRLWSGRPMTTVGRGRVIVGKDVEAALRTIGVAPDADLGGGQAAGKLAFVHRRLADGDLYFVSNRDAAATAIEARFRVTGKAPELWHADTGAIEPAAYRIEGGETIVPLALDGEESVHVVFRTPATAPSRVLPATTLIPVATLDGRWQVAFEPGRGAPAKTTLDTLGSLSEQAEPGIKYFSGVSTYTTGFTAPAHYRPGERLLLDLGQVGDLAEVRVNGQVVGTAWHAPYRLDIGAATKRGRNRLEVRVANLWVNRLIGDAQKGATKVTFTTMPTYKPSTPLRQSGLIGPVRLLSPRSRGAAR